MKKRAVWITTLCFIILVIFLCIIYIVYCKNKVESIELVNDMIELEYGEIYKPTIEDLIGNRNTIDKEQVNINIEGKYNELQEYLEVGEHQLILKYKNSTLVQKIIVKDTIPPQLEILKDTIEVIQEEVDTYDFKAIVNASDLSNLKEIQIDKSSIDAIPGEYLLKVSVEDDYGNTTTKEIKVKVIQKQENEKENVQVNEVKKPNTKKDTSNASNSASSTTDTPTSSPSKNETISQGKPDNPTTDVNPPKQSCTTKDNHAIKCGNSKKWYLSKSAAIEEFRNDQSYWGKKWENDEIDTETYKKNCPYAYQIYSCPLCNQWTMDLNYRL